MTQEEFNTAYELGMETAWCVARKIEDLRRANKFAECYGKDVSLWQLPVKEALSGVISYEEANIDSSFIDLLP